MAPLKQVMIVAIICAGAVAGLVALRLLGRSVVNEATKARVAATWPTSPSYSELHATEVARVRVGGVVDVGDEMLIELRKERDAPSDGDDVIWLLGPSSIAAIVALNRWRDADVVVTVSGGPGRFLLQTDQARVKVTGRVPIE